MKEGTLRTYHIRMWNFVIEVLEQCKTQDLGVTKLSAVKEEFLDKMRNSLRNETNLNEEGKEMKDIIENGLFNNCFACEFCVGDCRDCPLCEANGGTLKFDCIEEFSTFSCLAICVRSYEWDAAIVLAKEIRDSWRDVNE